MKEVVRISLSLVFLCIVLPSLLRTWNWGKDELDLVDLISQFKETNQKHDFYSWLGVESTANTVEIGRAHRKLVVQWHPNAAVTAMQTQENDNYKLANDIAVVLKSPRLRRLYDDMKRNGIPWWRGFYYFYTHHKIISMFLLLIIVVSVMEYIKMWDSYFTEKTTLDIFIKNAQKMATQISEKHASAKTHKSFIDLGDNRVITCEITPEREILVSDEKGQMVPLSTSTLAKRPSFLNCFFVRVPKQLLFGKEPACNPTTIKRD
ncbi:hypothetical protein K501DRAFT_259180 [Backusella circina FSU 941]|nr:hypothetical protein K501DRAFT_259180 [Backusella circina FSU 941]